DRNIEEVQRARARLIAPSVGSERSAIEVCERWLKHPTDTTLRLYGALGLASAGTWTDAVIDALGRFGATHWELSPGDVGRVVRQAAPAERERLRELVRMRPTPDEHAPRDLQISAACLLAVGGAWNEEVAQVVKLTLADRPSTQRTDEAKAVVRYCAREAAVQGALLDWMGDDSSSLGSFAREIVEDVAPLIKDLPAAVLKRTTSAEGSTREKLESLLVSIGMERTTLIETLRAWVVSPQLAQEQKRCAASILLGLAPGDDQLHEALQHGMRQPDSMERVHWAQLALGHGRELSDAALAALQSCARSPEQAVRKLVYTGMHVSRSWLLEQQPPTRWLACAADREVPAAARLEAVEFLAGSPALRARLEPVLRELLDTDDPAVRVGALKRLSSLGRLDAHAATLAAEEIARTGNETALRVLLRDCPPSLFTPGLLQAYLRALPLEDPSTSSEERCEHLSRWHSRLAELASRDLSCLESLLDALGRPGQAGAAVTDTLSFMLPPKNLPVRDAFRERLSREARGSDPVALRRLVYLCVRDEETRHAAIEASRALDLNSLSQWRLGWLALRMDADAPEDALRLWLRVLEGDDLELILQAATRLFHRYPEKARAWLPPALSRLLASSNPSNRLDAGSLALELGILEEKAHTALLSCLDPVGQEYATKWNTSFSLDEYRYPVEPPRDGDPLKQPLLFRRGRVDFMAMHVLCHYRPDIGLPRLAEWLKDQEWERFSCAARLLAKRRDFRESVRVTLEHRLGSAPGTQLEHIMGLVEKCGLFSTAMVSQVIARHGAEDPSFSDVDQCLQWCLRAHPEIWALIRSQDPARRADFAHLIDRGVRINADTIAFAVELAFAHIHPSEVVSKLRSWCRTPQGEVVRGWLRQALEAQALPSDIPSLFLFDNLAAMGELPAERRIGVLRRVLDIELPAPEEEGRSSLLEQQTTAGLRLLELGGHDERIASILEAAVYELQGLYNEELFQFASALLTLRPVDEALRKRLVKRVIRPWFSNSLAQELQVLEQQAGLSRPELIDVLIARLQALAPDTSSEIPTLLEALERLGCEQERRTTLLLELVSQRGATLPVYMRLTLAGRSELPASDAAKLLLSVIAESGWDVREAARLWLERFATRRAKPADEKLRLHHADSRYLSHRLQLLETLSPVDERAWLEQLLAELVGTPTDRVLALYRRARGDDPSLSPQEWTQLMDWLTLQPGDARTTQLGKQWLMLGLWQAQEPSTVTAVLNS
ncbi:MAG TPA: hypothetical protein VEU33_07415, partial [Archangium sp.]|nr:hypothetical protein [Archangium sp.]